MSLIPYAGIAFLWFIGVIRTRLGDQEDKLFATAFLGSGLLFVAMLFSAAAVNGALLHLYAASPQVSTDDARFGSAIVAAFLGTFGIRMAAVFTLVVTNLGRRTAIVPTWLVVIGYLTAVTLLLAPPRTVSRHFCSRPGCSCSASTSWCVVRSAGAYHPCWMTTSVTRDGAG